MPDHKTKPIDKLNPRQIKNFMKKFRQGSEDECWIWIGNRKGEWYGQFRVGSRMCNAHRVSFMLYTGEDPGPAMLLHRCDNPACVNPSHLWKGSLDENNKDAATKGRTASGDRNGLRIHPEAVERGSKRYNSVLTENIVRDARDRYLEGWKPSVLAKYYGINFYTLYDAIIGKSWKHV